MRGRHKLVRLDHEFAIKDSDEPIWWMLPSEFIRQIVYPLSNKEKRIEEQQVDLAKLKLFSEPFDKEEDFGSQSSLDV